MLGLLHRPSQLPDSPGSEGRPPGPDTRDSDRFPCHSHVPGDSPGWCPFPTVKVFLLPPPEAAQAFGGQYLRVFHYPPNSSGYPRSIAVIHHRAHSLSTAQGGPAGRGNQRPVPQRFLPPRRLHCRMSDELFVPKASRYLTGSKPGSSGWPRPAAPASVPVLAYRPANPAISANRASPGPAVPLSRREQQPQPRSHTRRPTERVILCAYNHATPEISNRCIFGAPQGSAAGARRRHSVRKGFVSERDSHHHACDLR